MDSITTPLLRHHKHCDELFADAEASAAANDWTQCRLQLFRFSDVLESHFRTEEEILFPGFEAATGMVGGPTQMMRYEHAQMRELIEQLKAALENRGADSFAGVAETLLVLMQQHNMKEENILYPMCNRALAGQIADLGKELNARLEMA